MRIISLIHDALYGAPTLALLFAVFLYLNLKTRFIGVRKLGPATRAVLRRDKSGGETSPIKAVCVSLCATVGTGNIVGVAGAVTLGGAGAVFWMWVSGILAMSVKFCEVYLSACFRKNGGAFGYIYAAFGDKRVQTLFCIFGLFSAFGIGNFTQTNAAASSAAVALTSFNISAKTVRFSVGIIFFITAFLLLKKEKTAADWCEKFLPFMAVSYIGLCVFALFLVRGNLQKVIFDIIRGAFLPKAVTGGAVASLLCALQSGVARGVFSNEAGLSTAALAYEKSKGNAINIALPTVFEVFIDTIVLCTLTALVVLSSGTAVYGRELGAYTTLCAFISIMGRRSVYLFCPLVCFFAFSSVIGWGIYARRFAEKVGIGGRVIGIIYAAACIIGAVVSPDAVWKLAEIGSLFMMFVNCAALIFHRDRLSYKKLGYKNRNDR